MTHTTKIRTHPESQFWKMIRLMRHNRLSVAGAVIILVLLIISIFGNWLAPHDPIAIDMGLRLHPPSVQHPFGTDDFGRDVFSRVIVATQVSIKVGIISVSISLTLGTLLGAISGYYGGWLDEVVMRSMDILFAFPAILLAIAIMAALGPGVENAMIAIGIIYTPIFARITRGSVISVRQETFVEAAHSIGAKDFRIIFFHILPNVIAPVIVETTLSLAFAILSEAALSFLGLGTQPPDPSWGRMLSESRGYIQDAPWLGVFPGLVIMLTVMGFNFLGDGLRDALDPRMRDLLETRGTR